MDESTTLHWAAYNGQNITVRILVFGLGVDKEARDNEGKTPLQDAAFAQRSSTVTLLVETLEATKEAIDNKGNTAMMRAAISGHKVVVQKLFDLGTSKDFLAEGGGKGY
jgi:ankyrin repeat protein